MDAATAAARGALSADPATKRTIMVPETVDELAIRRRETDAGARVSRPWWMKPDLLQLPVVLPPRWYDDQVWSSRLPG